MKRVVEAAPIWRNALTDPAPSGSTVLALSLGGTLISVQWSSKALEYCVAWLPYPKVPKEIKDILSKQWEVKDPTV